MGSSYTFVVIADTQLGVTSELVSLGGGNKFISLADKLQNLSEELYEQECEFSRRGVRIINNMKPKPEFVVVNGDLVNAPPQQAKLNAVQIKDFKKIFAELDPEIKMVCVSGNHDVGNSPTKESIEVYRKHFGKDFYAFDINEDRYVIINTQYYKNDVDVKNFSEEHDAFVAREFDKDGTARRHTTVFGHIPPFVYSPDEPSAYFVLEQNLRKELLKKAVQGGIKNWFSGHFHRLGEGSYEHEGKKLNMYTNAAIGGNISSKKNEEALSLEGMDRVFLDDTVSGMRVVNVTPEGLNNKFYSLVELEAKIGLSKV
eukprot:maker-scaffold_13-snap-gene-1.48-mRNA-1 protein AED:0.04 eAED:0.04 QI:127/1/1/1/0.71/0.62/8/896/313